MRLSGALGDTENAPNLAVGFPLAQPEEHVTLALSQTPRRSPAQPFTEGIPFCWKRAVAFSMTVGGLLGIGANAPSNIGDVGQQQIQNGPIPLTEIPAIAVKAD